MENLHVQEYTPAIRGWSDFLNNLMFLGIINIVTAGTIQPGLAGKRTRYGSSSQLRQQDTTQLWANIAKVTDYSILPYENVLSIINEIPHDNRTVLRDNLLACLAQTTILLTF
jgi:hypothetical protein